MLATLANNGKFIYVREVNTHEFRPNNRLASISYYYGDSSALEDIFWANRDKLKNPGSISLGLKLYIPILYNSRNISLTV